MGFLCSADDDAIRVPDLSPCEEVQQVLNSWCCYVCVQAEETSTPSTSDESFITEDLKSIYATKREWAWRGYSIAYTVQGCGPPVLLVHGFGASIGHWRRYKAHLSLCFPFGHESAWTLLMITLYAYILKTFSNH